MARPDLSVRSAFVFDDLVMPNHRRQIVLIGPTSAFCHKTDLTSQTHLAKLNGPGTLIGYVPRGIQFNQLLQLFVSLAV